MLPGLVITAMCVNCALAENVCDFVNISVHLLYMCVLLLYVRFIRVLSVSICVYSMYKVRPAKSCLGSSQNVFLTFCFSQQKGVMK